ncbi:PRC-barrel domain-containing protein [Tranquillimonas alkanivorans]|uniref:PRC-barrel domain-containing protein n=1 Tax=Tranquillimonas alkanivorans TaxID=441119 RepID=A0A1I5WDH7_9RHOB|nr:PRC-barrel domain-containing protein [Tranquillimonas alkanivorans]SFQ17728.1 PRC-barrel domain-containing protein [Tranquillimonas alkanivorans]
MRTTVSTIAAAVLASAAFVQGAASQEQPMQAPASECYNELQSTVPPLERSLSGSAKRDLQQLLRPAIILARRGNEAACRAILEEIEQIGQQGNVEPEVSPPVEQAAPMDGVQVIPLNDVLDREVVGADGDEIGDVRDVVIVHGEPTRIFAVIDRDGWFNDAEQLAVPMNAIQRSSDGELMLPISEDALEEIPGALTDNAYDPQVLDETDAYWEQQ